MHELSVTESILEIALRNGREAGAARVSDIYLVIGELSTIVDESVQLYWDIISENTAAAGSILHFRRIPGRLGCRDCGHTYSPREDLPCPVCGSLQIDILAGEEFYVDSIAIELAGEAHEEIA